ncbi:hypothetical protein [Streptomyces sp. NPDC051183]|uniref:hypothetical protein n=1 Tax=unclassified Streptomyces TaxID=2593676 RepID=UPI0034131CCC
MDEQGGAGGVPPHDGHAPRRTRPHHEHHGEQRTDAADTDEASRLDRPGPVPDPMTGRPRWVGPKGQKGQEGQEGQERGKTDE